MNITKKDISFPKRKKDAHKGQAGKLLVIGGSEHLVGAPLLASLAAYRSGVDLVTVASLEDVAYTINAHDPSIITHKLKGTTWKKKHVKELLPLLEKNTAVLIGNGLGKEKGTQKFLTHLFLHLPKNIPLVIDADALHTFPLDCMKEHTFILTPHTKEFQDLIDYNQLTSVEELQNLLQEQQLILLKGEKDTFIQHNSLNHLKGGVPELAVAGTGDILAGLTAGFLAQGLTIQQAAHNASYLNKHAGKKAKESFGNFTATELLAFLTFS